MTWVNGNLQIYNTFASLVRRNGDVMTVNSDCLDTLEEINQESNTEDSNLRTFRRAIGFSKNIQNDSIPLLIHLKENKNITNSNQIVNCTIKLLVNLTIPTEHLSPSEMMEGSDVGKHSIFELNSSLRASKESFSDSRSTKAILDHIKQITECDSPLTSEQCDSINNCLLSSRNILHIPEMNVPGSHSTLQNQIVWNLFTQSVDKIIIFLVTCPEKIFWSVTMVQLIALLYKDQHVGTLQKSLNIWSEASLSESSEDNESNTSAPFQGSGHLSPFITSDPTSDSSDAGGGHDMTKIEANDSIKIGGNDSIKIGGNDSTKIGSNAMKDAKNAQSKNKTIKRVQSTETEASSSSGVSSSLSQSTTDKSKSSVHTDQSTISKKRECPSSTSEISDCGYATQAENQEFVSTSSNDDDQPSQKPVHQKPHTFQKTRYITGKKTITASEKKELGRKKSVKRSKTNIINVKGLMHHLPTDEDISNVSKEFTVDFLSKGYSILVKDLHTQSLTNVHAHIDTSHFFWLVTYFLKFATQSELDSEHSIPVLSYDLLSFSVLQGVWAMEEFELKTRMVYVDSKPCMRRSHLVVTAIREFLQAVDTYQKIIQSNEEDKENLLSLQCKIVGTQEIGCSFLLLLRHYDGKLQSRQYLQDLILTNHIYLLFLDNVSKLEEVKPKSSLMEHLKDFAAVEIMCKYGILSEKFKENGEFINNCIFTMMHHIGGDSDNVSILFQPNILKTFSQIWETDFELCDDWADSIEYVIHKFINTPRKSPCLSDKNLDSTSDTESSENSDQSEFPERRRNSYQNKNKKNLETIDEITEIHKENGINHKTISIIKDLSLQNIISEKQYKDFTKNEQPEKVRSNGETKSVQNEGDKSVDKEVEALRSYSIKEGRQKYLLWIQDVLLEICYAKLSLENPEKFGKGSPTVEPTIFYNSSLNLPLPIIHWTTEQSAALKFPPFVVLLHKLGLYLPGHTGKLFVRIPNFWSAGVLYGKAQQLGPINKDKIKFDVGSLEGGNKGKPVSFSKSEENATKDNGKFFYDSRETPYSFRYTPPPNELRIVIPEQDICNLPIPHLESSESIKNTRLLSIMDLSTGNHEVDRDSICETVSSGSNGMCVSDEENYTVFSLDLKYT